MQAKQMLVWSIRKIFLIVKCMKYRRKYYQEPVMNKRRRKKVQKDENKPSVVPSARTSVSRKKCN